MSEVHIGKNIRAIRLMFGLKQEAFATKLGVSQQNISRLESRKKVSRAKLAAVATALAVSIETIETFDEKVILRVISDQVTAVGQANDMIAYFQNEIAKRDQSIDQLQKELERLRIIWSRRPLIKKKRLEKCILQPARNSRQLRYSAIRYVWKLIYEKL